MRFDPSRRDALQKIGAFALGTIAPTGLQHYENDVRAHIARSLKQGETTGMAIAVVSGGHIVWEEGFGWADPEARIPVTSRSPFILESITKTITTTLLTTFAAEGRLELDAPANLYLGQSKLFGTNGDPGKATVRLLGAHASGLPGTFQPVFGAPSPSPSAFLKKYGQLAFPPGQIWEYSNVGFEALGGIAANLADVDFGELMQRRVLSPLGLTDSFWDTNRVRAAKAVPRYSDSGKKLPFHLTTTPPSGELFSSAHDVAMFALWNMQCPLPNGGRLLNGHWIDELHKPAFRGMNGAVSTFGWAVELLPSGERVIHKAGGGYGASTLVCMAPERKLACVVLNNHATRSLTNDVTDLIMRSYLPAWKTPDENGEPPQRPFVMTKAFAGLWKGTLSNDGISTPLTLNFSSSQPATLSLGPSMKQPLSEMRAEGSALLAKAAGTIQSPEVLRANAHALAFKVIPCDGRLVGRVLAIVDARDQGMFLPFVVSLARV